MIECCLSSYDADPCQFHTCKMVRAVKTHQCYECGEQVDVGELHEYVFVVDQDGNSESIRTCVVCLAVRNDHDCGDGYIYGALWDTLRECYGTEVVDDPEDHDPDDPHTNPWEPPPTCGSTTAYYAHHWRRDSDQWVCGRCGLGWIPRSLQALADNFRQVNQDD